ncbi:hypothetical protein BT096_11715, partial [Corynebacterium diphtheriae]
MGAVMRISARHEAAAKDLVATVGRFHADVAVHTMTKIPGGLWFSLVVRCCLKNTSDTTNNLTPKHHKKPQHKPKKKKKHQNQNTT